MPRQYIALPTAAPRQQGGDIRLRCPACGESSSMAGLEAQAMVCGWCDFHLPLEAGPHSELLVDEGSFRPLEAAPAGPVRLGWATLSGRPLAVAVSGPASRWSALEIGALAALAEQAGRERRPLLWVVTAAQGVAAPLQWPGLQIALGRVGEAGPEHSRGTPAPWIALVSGPVYGPAAALATQADLVLAEPGAVLAPVLPEVLRPAGRLPLASTRSPQQLLREGWADAVVPRHEQRTAVAELLELLGSAGADAVMPPAAAPGRSVELAVRAARARGTPAAGESCGLLERLAPFYELAGDRQSADDPALVGGLARGPDGLPVLVLATACGERRAEVRRRRAGAIGAAGWRKATRLLRLAGRFNLPVVLLVDRPALRTGGRGEPSEAATALGEMAHVLLTIPVPTVALRTAAGEDAATLALSLADALLAPEELAPRLQEEGWPVSGTWGAGELDAQLARVLEALRQDYLRHGALGRRALAQHRYLCWTRLSPVSSSSDPATWAFPQR